MPTADTVRFTKLADSLTRGLVNFAADEFGVLLLDTLTVGTLADDAQFVADVLAAGTEPVGDGYTAGGLTLANTSWIQDGSIFLFTCDDPVWGAATITASFVLFFDKTPGTDATNPVIGYADFGGPVSSTGTDFRVPINPAGLVNI